MKKRMFSILEGVRNRHVLGSDIVMFLFIPSIALALRVESLEAMWEYTLPLALYTLLSLLWKLTLFFPFGLYNRYWRYASVDELSIVLIANLFSWLTGVGLFFGLMQPTGIVTPEFPRSVPILDGLLTTLFTGGLRFLLRLGYGYKHELVPDNAAPLRKRALIVGAGVAGSMILKELHMNRHVPIEPVAFLDDDPRKHRVRIHGVPVMGKITDLPAVVREMEVEEVIIAMPTAPGKVIREVVQQCKDVGIPSKTIPGIFEILNGSARVSQLREVKIEDLLRRGVVQTDTDGVANLIRGARIMITGAGGSIGSELCRQIAAFSPAAIIMLGHGENSVFDISKELTEGLGKGGGGKFPATKVHTVIADVRDRERMRQVYQLYRPELVFHAAAHKHVGLMEDNIPDAVTNNVLGTKILAELAAQFDVHRFVMVSSDKAVNPTSIMGVTKRVAELVVGDIAHKKKKPFVSVRFGNVLGSRGSVVPIFEQQIAQGGPVCVTDPETSRYFMTIPEAVQLVLQAATMGEGGEVFVLDMGEPIKILDLAKDLIRLSGFKEGEDIRIVFTGLKHGEKLTEELFFPTEVCEPSQHEKILVCRNGEQGASDSGAFGQSIDRLIGAAQQGALKNVKAILKQIVPEFQENIDIPETAILSLTREKATMTMIDEPIR